VVDFGPERRTIGGFLALPDRQQQLREKGVMIVRDVLPLTSSTAPKMRCSPGDDSEQFGVNEQVVWSVKSQFWTTVANFKPSGDGDY
jgi:hypothetical protein